MEKLTIYPEQPALNYSNHEKYIFAAGFSLLLLASCARDLVSDLGNTDPIQTGDIILQKEIRAYKYAFQS